MSHVSVSRNRQLSDNSGDISDHATAVVTHPTPDEKEPGAENPRFVNDRVLAGIHGYVSAWVYKAAEDKWYCLADKKHNLLTTDGRDFFHAQVYINNAAGTRGANFIAVTTDTGAPAAGDTTLATEITTNGLARADATTKTHTDNTNASTIEHEWTASGTHTAVQKCALFNASSAGIMTHEGTFTAATLISGDKLKVTYTLNLG
jgi:hypothetical protein